jgi:asparagine synthase (glutamine-hydrolysing)
LGLAEVAAGIPVGLLEDTLDVRHPYLYRPLVEFALGLPPEFCARPYARKWILREAMRGILPEAVRTRVGKGAVFGRLAWSLAAQRALLDPLTKDSILEDLGVIDGGKLRAAFMAAPHERDGRVKLHAAVQHTLAIEAWLQLRSGRWPCGGHSTKVA